MRPRQPRALVVVPTRELAVQIAAVFDGVLAALESSERHELSGGGNTGGSGGGGGGGSGDDFYASALRRYGAMKEPELLRRQLQQQQRGAKKRQLGPSTGLVSVVASGEKRHAQRNALKVSE